MNIKQKLRIVAGLIILSILILSGASILSWQLNHRLNNFKRLFPPHIVHVSDVSDLKFNGYTIAGISSNTVYLANIRNPLYILIYTISRKDTQNVKIRLPEKQVLFAGRLIVDSPFFYLSDQIKHSIFSGKIPSLQANKTISAQAFFVDLVPISNSSLVIRTISPQTKTYTLAKESIRQSAIQWGNGLLEKQSDGLFELDGILNYDKTTGSLIYVYHYKNKFICMDTLLHLIYKGKTIDTVEHAHITAAYLPAENAYYLASPPRIVNKKSYASNNQLFVLSALKANNENSRDFSNASVIDVYNLRNGIYKYSFYLYNYKGSHLNYFEVYENTLVAIFDHYLLTYKLNPSYY